MSKDIIVIKCGDHLLKGWVENMSALLPEFEIVPYKASFDADRVTYIIGWCPDARWINGFSNLKSVVSIGSGVDHIVHLEELRSDIPVIRTVSPDLIQRMKEFVVVCVLAWHRQLPAMIENQHKAEWRRYTADTAEAINVGVMGFGRMGSATAEALSHLGYRVSVWASSPRPDIGYAYFHGSAQLYEFAEQNNVVVCQLPLTKSTQDILDYRFLTRIRKNGCLVNVGRGGHLVDNDLFKALEEGYLSAAFLDVFRTEPLPPDSPFWSAPKVFVTCHSAAYISPEAGPKVIAKNIKLFEAGEPVSPLYRRDLGY
jgi:glyoxylate/hydroxypyruvate reductase A